MTPLTLTETVDDRRALALRRQGVQVGTSQGTWLEMAGGSHACCIVHDDGEVLRGAIQEIARSPFAVSGRTHANRSQQALAEIVIGYTNDPDARVFFTSGGTEAIETAVRIAHHIQRQRGLTHATAIVGRQYSYHGMSVLARNIGGHPVHGQLGRGINFGWPKLNEPRCHMCPLGLEQPSCGIACASGLAELLALDSERIAAVIVEPVSGTTGGALVPPEGYLNRLSKICKAHGVLLIVDETVTGFWRVGTAFASMDIDPDIVVGGKCLAAGWAPIGCTIVSGQLCSEMRASGSEVPLRLTFSGNAVAAAFACSAQAYVMKNDLGGRVRRNSNSIRDALENQIRVGGFQARVHGTGHLWAIEVDVGERDPVAVFASLRSEAGRKHVELMGGTHCAAQTNSVHVLVSPAFDAHPEEIDCVARTAADLVKAALADNRRGRTP